MPGAKQYNRIGDEATVDELLSALADARRRAVIHYFHDSTRSAATVEELATELGDDAGPQPPERLMAVLHHAALPKLSQAGLVEYDPAERTVRYCGEELRDPVQQLFDDVAEVATA